MKLTPSITRRFLALLAALAMLTAACGSSTTAATSAASEPDNFWSELMIVGDEREGFASLREMGEKADLVVLAEIVDFEKGRTIQYDAEEDIVTYGLATVRVIETINGESVSDSLPVEFLMTQQPDDVSSLIDSMSDFIPEGRLLMFLRAKTGEGETGLYRLVNSTGLWSQASGEALVAPLAEEILKETEGDPADPDHTHEAEEIYADELTDISSIDELAEWVRR